MFKWPFKKANKTRAETENKKVKLMGIEEFFQACNRDYIKFSEQPDVKICIKKISDLVSNMTIFLMKNGENGDTRVKNGLSRVLDITPNPYLTRKTLIYKTVEELLLTGNSILLPKFKKDKNYKADELLQELQTIDGGTISYQNFNNKDGYFIRIGNTKFQNDEIIHFVYNPIRETPWIGEGFKIYLKDVLQTLSHAQTIKDDFYTKHYKPNIIFSFMADTSDFTSIEQRDRLYNKWLETKPGQPYILPDQIIDIKSFQAMSLRDIAINESVEVDKKAVASMFGVPSFMLGIGGFDIIEYNNFIDITISPIAKILEQELTRKLILSRDYYIKFNLESLKAFDTESRVNLMYEGRKLGVYNANEIRVQSGFEPIDKPEMNEYSMLENYIPINKLAAQKKLIQEGEDGN